MSLSRHLGEEGRKSFVMRLESGGSNRQAAQPSPQTEVMPELRRHNPAQYEAGEISQPLAPCKQLAILAHARDVEITRPRETFVADEFAHKCRRVSEKALRQRGPKHMLWPLSHRFGQHTLRGLSENILVAQSPGQFPARIQARGKGNEIFIEKGIAGFHAVGHDDSVALRAKQQAG